MGDTFKIRSTATFWTESVMIDQHGPGSNLVFNDTKSTAYKSLSLGAFASSQTAPPRPPTPPKKKYGCFLCFGGCLPDDDQKLELRGHHAS